MFKLSSIIKPDFFKVVTLANLQEINNQLRAKGLPDYFRGLNPDGQKMFNPSYSIKQTPRFVIGWRGVRLNQLYLMPSVGRDNWQEYYQFAKSLYPNMPIEDVPAYISQPEITINLNQ